METPPVIDDISAKLMMTIAKELVISFPPGRVDTLSSARIDESSKSKLSVGEVTSKVALLKWDTTRKGLEGTGEGDEKWLAFVNERGFSMHKISGKKDGGELVDVNCFLPDPDFKAEGVLFAKNAMGEGVSHFSTVFLALK